MITRQPSVLISWRHVFKKAIIRPFAFFVKEPIIQLFGIYVAFMWVSSDFSLALDYSVTSLFTILSYGVVYLILTTGLCLPVLLLLSLLLSLSSDIANSSPWHICERLSRDCRHCRSELSCSRDWPSGMQSNQRPTDGPYLQTPQSSQRRNRETRIWAP